MVVRSRVFIENRTRQNDGVADSSGRSLAGRKGMRVFPGGILENRGEEHDRLRDQIAQGGTD